MESQNTLSLRHLISACLDLVVTGGEIARHVVSSGKLEIKEKTGPSDLLTIADLRIQAYIQGSLLQIWPDLVIVGEESSLVLHGSGEDLRIEAQFQGSPLQLWPDETYSSRGKVDLTHLDNVSIDPNVVTEYPISQLTVFIDPIDATKEFTEGIYSNVTTLIGIAVNDEAIAGVIYQPWSKDDIESPKGCLCWGIVGHGAEGLGPQEPRDNLVVAVTRTISRVTEQLEQGLKNLNPSEILRVGGTGYKSLLIAQGKVDVMYCPTAGTSFWDTCAPEAIVKSVGGDMTDVNGNRIRYQRKGPHSNKNGVVTSRNNHKEIIEKINLSF